MMMTHSYYGSANIDTSPPPPGTIFRHHPRAMPASSAYYARPIPYAYYGHHPYQYDPNVEYAAEAALHTTILEHESTPPNEQARRRIAVAVSLAFSFQSCA